ncbi:MAG TPA: hypothetical protein VGM43_19265, partial [Bryobacteraceae bacterium]
LYANLLSFSFAVRFPSLLLGRRNTLTRCSAQHAFFARRGSASLGSFSSGRRRPLAKLLTDMRYPLQDLIAFPLEVGQGVTQYVGVLGIFAWSCHN